MASIINAALSGGLISTGDTSGQLQLQTGGTTALTINSSQQVLFNTTTNTFSTYGAFSEFRKDQNSASYVTIQNQNAGSSGSAGLLLTAYGNSWVNSIGSNANNTNALNWAVDATSPSIKMTLTTAGNLGIGTTSPNRLLSLYATQPVFQITNVACGNTQGTLQYQGSGGTDFILDNQGSGSGGNILFQQAGTLRMQLDTSGNLLVGATASGSDGWLSLKNSFVSKSGLSLWGNTAGDVGTQALQILKYDNNNTTSQVFVRFIVNNGGSASGQINANGASAAAFGSWSDSRLKENIVDLPSQLSNILALRPVEFDYIESEGGGHQIGFIAQEVNEIYPDLVGQRADGMFTLTDMNKNDARLIKAIQELSTQLTELKAEVATLRGA